MGKHKHSFGPPGLVIGGAGVGWGWGGGGRSCVICPSKAPTNVVQIALDWFTLRSELQ